MRLTSPLCSEQSPCHYPAWASFHWPTWAAWGGGDDVRPHLCTQAPWPLWNSVFCTDPSLLHLCGETHVTGGHFHDCVAIRISWIRGPMHKDPLVLWGSFITGSAWCELYSVTTTTPYSHQLKSGAGGSGRENASRTKLPQLLLAINSLVAYYEGHELLKTASFFKQETYPILF